MDVLAMASVVDTLVMRGIDQLVYTYSQPLIVSNLILTNLNKVYHHCKLYSIPCKGNLNDTP